VGDVVQDNTTAQWQRASAGFKILDDAKIPYAIAPGNHDCEATPSGDGVSAGDLRATQLFNQYFPVSRFTLQQGRFEANKSDNAYYTFEANGFKWIVITLEYFPRLEAAKWMDGILNNYPDHNAIIVTHALLTVNGNIPNYNPTATTVFLSDMFNSCIKPHKNVLMALSGHWIGSAWRTDTGANGNTVYTILQDYQGEFPQQFDYIRLLEIDTDNKTIQAKMYGPHTNVTLNDASQFTFSNVNFIKVIN
jgi:hypothetical protein